MVAVISFLCSLLQAALRCLGWASPRSRPGKVKQPHGPGNGNGDSVNIVAASSRPEAKTSVLDTTSLQQQSAQSHDQQSQLKAPESAVEATPRACYPTPELSTPPAKDSCNLQPSTLTPILTTQSLESKLGLLLESPPLPSFSTCPTPVLATPVLKGSHSLQSSAAISGAQPPRELHEPPIAVTVLKAQLPCSGHTPQLQTVRKALKEVNGTSLTPIPAAATVCPSTDGPSSSELVTPAAPVTQPFRRYMVDAGKVVGVANTVARYCEAKPLAAHDTPFTIRVARQLEIEELLVQQEAAPEAK